MMACLHEFSFEVVYHSGKKHTNADALSLRPCSQCGREEPLPSAVHKLDGAVAVLLAHRSPHDLHKLQLNDATTGPVLWAVEKNT